MLSSLSYQGMCNLRDLSSVYGHALVILTKLSKSKIEVVQEQKTSQVAHALIAEKGEHWT